MEKSLVGFSVNAFPMLIYDNSDAIKKLHLFDESHVRHHKFARDV